MPRPLQSVFLERRSTTSPPPKPECRSKRNVSSLTLLAQLLGLERLSSTLGPTSRLFLHLCRIAEQHSILLRKAEDPMKDGNIQVEAASSPGLFLHENPFEPIGFEGLYVAAVDSL